MTLACRAIVSASVLMLSCAAYAQNTVWLSPNTYGATGDKVWFYRAPVFNTNAAGSAHEDALGWITTVVYSQEQRDQNGKTYWQLQTRGSMNCSAKTMRVSGYAVFLDKNGVQLFAGGNPELSERFNIQPDTVSGDLYKFLCG